MISLKYHGLLGVIFLCGLRNERSWNSEAGLLPFDAVDMNKDGIITEEEGLANPNNAVVKQWVALLEKIPKDAQEGGVSRKEYEYLYRVTEEAGKRRQTVVAFVLQN